MNCNQDPSYSIREFLASVPVSSHPQSQDHAGEILHSMVRTGLDKLDLPGSGHTLRRWRALAAVAAHDLSLGKLFESHTDALSILAEARLDLAPSLGIWAVWCAEPPQARLTVSPAFGQDDLSVILNGRKSWCSGAQTVTHALVSCWNADGEPCLAAVHLDQPGVAVTDEGWHAVGMADTRSVDVIFKNARGIAVGPPHFYTRRPGFWHGGAGIAACWHGAAAELAVFMQESLTHRQEDLALANMGRADVAISASAWGLRAAAMQIDARPAWDACRIALRTRLMTERSATDVMQAFGQALGAAPVCRNSWAARMMADLPVFLRQSHGDRDFAALARPSVLPDAATMPDASGESTQALPGEEEWRL